MVYKVSYEFFRVWRSEWPGEDEGVGGGVVVPEFKDEGKGPEINTTDIKVVESNKDTEICRWWAKALYTPQERS